MKIYSSASYLIFAILMICFVSMSANAELLDLTVFGGAQNPGKLTFETAPGTEANLIQTFDPKTFGVVGARFGHGGLIGGEHTLEYAPKFLNSDNYAVIYHSNLRVQPSFSFVKPYGTVGAGVVYSGGNSLSSFGAKFGFNYGGGITFAGRLIGVNLDLRGYSVPKISIAGFTTQPRLDFAQATAGISFHF